MIVDDLRSGQSVPTSYLNVWVLHSTDGTAYYLINIVMTDKLENRSFCVVFVVLNTNIVDMLKTYKKMYQYVCK